MQTLEQITPARITTKTVHTSPHKARLAVDLIRGGDATDIISVLKLAPNRSAGIIEKILMSAVVNVENSFDLDTESSAASEVLANEGSTMRRSCPCVKGSASPINKRTNHITIVVIEE